MENQSAEVVRPHRIWNILLWITQVIFGIMFILIGMNKLITALPALVSEMPWVSDVDVGLIRFIGTAELMGGIGLILPAALRIVPQLTVIAAGAIVLLMLFAAIFHLSRGEGMLVTYTIPPLFACLFIVWGRWIKYPIQSRDAEMRAVES